MKLGVGMFLDDEPRDVVHIVMEHDGMYDVIAELRMPADHPQFPLGSTQIRSFSQFINSFEPEEIGVKFGDDDDRVMNCMLVPMHSELLKRYSMLCTTFGAILHSG